MKFDAIDDCRWVLNEVENDLADSEETDWFEWWKSDFLSRNIIVRSCHVKYDLNDELRSELKMISEDEFEDDLMSANDEIEDEISTEMMSE